LGKNGCEEGTERMGMRIPRLRHADVGKMLDGVDCMRLKGIQQTADEGGRLPLLIIWLYINIYKSKT